MRVRLPCWPTRASSCHHSSIGLPCAPAGESRRRPGWRSFYAPPAPRHRLEGPHRDVAERQRLQDTPNTALVHRHKKAGQDPVPQRSRNRQRTTPSSAISGPWRTQAASCVFSSTDSFGDVRQAVDPLLVVPMHPVTQGLPIHPAGLGGLRTIMALQHQRQGQKRRTTSASETRDAWSRNASAS